MATSATNTATMAGVVLEARGLTLLTPNRRRTICSRLSFALPEFRVAARGSGSGGSSGGGGGGGSSSGERARRLRRRLERCHLLIQGPSGCGKSSLLRAFAGLWAAGSGAVRLRGLQGPLPSPPSSLSASAEGTDSAGNDSSGMTDLDVGGIGCGGAVAFLPQKSYLIPGTLRDNLLYPRVATTASATAAAAATTSQGDGGSQEEVEQRRRSATSDVDAGAGGGADAGAEAFWD